MKMEYKEEFERIKQSMSAEGVAVTGTFWSFAPYLQWVRIDALRKEDWPNGLSDNSVFVDIQIDMQAQKFEVGNCGHIWLTDADERKSYLCMCSMRKAVEAVGGKWLRKSKYKDAADLAKKVRKFWEQTMDCVDRATGGYPYKKMIVNIY